jgi:hypothetical protein
LRRPAPLTRVPIRTADGEIKFTGRLGMSDSLQATYLNNSTRQENASGIAAARLVDASTLVTRQIPNRLATANYNGTMGRGCWSRCSIRRKSTNS